MGRHSMRGWPVLTSTRHGELCWLVPRVDFSMPWPVDSTPHSNNLVNHRTFFGFFGVFIIPKWLIKVPGHFGILLDDSGNFENFVKIWSRRPPDYHQNALKNTREIMESSWKHIICVNMGHQKFHFFRNLYVLGTRFVRLFRFRFSFVFLVFFEYISWK